MAPFSIPAPSIIPLRLPVFGGSRSIDTNTKIQLLCETHLDHEIFFTLDGTKPQPYAGIVQGSKAIKYCSPFCLPPGKISIKAIAINTNIHTMRSSVITKCFEVVKVDSLNNKQCAKVKKAKKPNPKKRDSVENKKNLNGMMDIPIPAEEKEEKCDVEIHRLNPDSLKKEDDILNCFDQAFIVYSECDTENSDLEDSIIDESSFPVDHNVPDENDSLKESDDIKLFDAGFVSNEKESSFEVTEELHIQEENEDEPNVTNTNDTADTQFCCLKCDLTLQQCISCNKMNGVSSKFCIGCGKQLSRLCSFCSEYNPSVATFCQYCGKKLNSERIKLEPFSKVDHSIMAKPELKDVAIQMFPAMIDKNIQTVTVRSPVKKSYDVKRMPRYSPGGGYWHQQLDYICNHLKSHAYNNIEFRKEISEPMLCDFKSVHITKDENDVTVTVNFSSLKNKDLSEETKSKCMEVVTLEKEF